MAGKANGSVGSSFAPGSTQGTMAIVGAVLVLVTPPLAYYVSPGFALLLVAAIGLQLIVLRGSGGARYGRVGRAMATNGALLIVSLFVVGFINDFTAAHGPDLQMDVVGLGFTGVHLMLGIGLMLLDHHRATQSAH